MNAFKFICTKYSFFAAVYFIFKWTQNKLLFLKGDFDTQNMPENTRVKKNRVICG